MITKEADGLFISLSKKLLTRPSLLITNSFLLKNSLFFLAMFDKEISTNDPGLIFNSFLNDLID